MILRGKRALITGGAGFVGSHLADLLIDEGMAEVVAVDNLVRGRRENLANAIERGSVRFVEGDIRDSALMRRLVSETDVVFHQAALRITHCAAEPELAFEVMARATFDLLRLCAEQRVEKVVVASSASVYGLADRFPTPEVAHPYDNRTLYGALKLLSEGLLRAFGDMDGLRYGALRYFNVYGPRMDTQGKYTEVLIRWMERIDAGRSPVILGDGLQTMDFVHVRCVARANVAMALSETSGEAFNVASGREVSLRQLAETLLAVMGRPELGLEFGPERSVNAVPRRLADTTKIAEALGWRARISLEEGLDDLVTWWRRQRATALAEVPA